MTVDIFLTKVLAQLVYPLSFSLMLSTVAGLLLWRGWRRLGGACLSIAIVWLWLCSTPVFSGILRASLEQSYPAVPIQELPKADAILVLGGGLKSAMPPQRLTLNLEAAADRVWYAAQLYKAGKASWIVAIGGSLPWGEMGQPEAYAMAELLHDLGVPETAILLETESLNTHQNAKNSQPILESNHIHSSLLVTSALHMPRALRTFRSAGIQVLPATVDYEIVAVARRTLLDGLPDAQALDGSTRALKEYLGTWTYRVLGYLD